ncbi:MAG: RluA family pseudouridine synthase [Lachnospiraceae bacterium]|nr:RluA family pseudouridine synthase [Lachnospiraceae bacterium]
MHKKIITPNEANQRLDKFLHKYLPEAGNSFIYKMLRKKNITLNGKKADGNEKTLAGDEITFFISDETIRKFQTTVSGLQNYYQAYQQFTELKILFENEHLLIADKPAGLLSQKAKAEDISLNDWLIGYLLASNQINEESLKTFKPSALNRLDRNTCGISLCGKTLIGSQEISRLLKERKIQKYYQLIVKGEITKAGQLGGYLNKDEKNNKVQIIRGKGAAERLTKTIIDSAGKPVENVLTKYRPIKTNSTCTLVEAELVTGKTHQIRAHFAGIGHPLIGDYKYGDRQVNDEFKRLYGVESQLLHASRVVFPVMEAPLSDLSRLEVTSPSIFLIDVPGGK